MSRTAHRKVPSHREISSTRWPGGYRSRGRWTKIMTHRRERIAARIACQEAA